MKNRLFLILLLFCVGGCSHIRVVAFDKQANTVSVQGGKWDSEEAIVKQAEQYCGTSVTILSMQERMVGAYTSSNASGNAQSYGNSNYGSAYGSAVTTGIRRNVYTFSCSAKPQGSNP